MANETNTGTQVGCFCLIAIFGCIWYLCSMNTEARIIDLLHLHFPALQGVYLFGSRADGTSRAGSDYDIAFLNKSGTPELGAIDRFDLATSIGIKTEAEVDLVDLHHASTDFQFQIVSKGNRIFCADKTYCDFFDMTVYSMYQRLEEERKGIIEAVKKRGFIYG